MSGFSTRHANSVYDFQRLVRPELEKLLHGRIDITEARGDTTARTLDIDVGFDALCHTDGGVVGLANRVQWTEKISVASRPCPVCGETTTSVMGYFCAGCHFRGWWGRWK